ncbi:sensor histidine kinase [Microbacterium oleivorans]|uniref:sensor histidine kinase n=1 Tax=Microbacterium oleivorans TaxID=273677 RepID=UPI000767D08F|nr:ATP-binding protein [Microbacterium oleivorans]THE06597.1 PAS domain-containing sensor histidine kinase [Microbacterium oleivorans]
MPLFEMEATRSSRIRVFVRAQLPFLLGVLFIVGVALIAHPEGVGTPVVMAGVAITAAATVASVVIAWERLNPAWMALVAVADMLAVALFRAELMPFIPAVTILALFPILWLAYGFPWYGIVVAVIGAVFIIAFRYFYTQEWPKTPAEWANVFAFPALIVGIAVVVFIAARHLRRNSRRLAEVSRAQEDALREATDAEAIAVGILNTVNAGVAFYDKEGRLDIANPLAHQMVEMVGFSLDKPPYAGNDVLAADRVSKIPYDQQIIPRALRGENIDNHVEWLGPPEAQVAILASSGQVHSEDGRLLGTVVVAYDVTELADAVEVREQFLRTVSHELRTPITSITGFLDLIADAADPADEKLHRYIEIVIRKTNDLFDRVGDLLHANDTDKTLHVTPVDIAQLVATAAGNLTDAASAQSMRIELAGPPTLPAEGDAGHLVIAITELLRNAVKFGTPETTVTAGYALRGDRIEIAVSNIGPGITHAEQRRVFDRFYRTAYARSREIQGFGLGLTNLRAIVVAHAGHIRIDSTPGRWTTVTISLPVRLATDIRQGQPTA